MCKDFRNPPLGRWVEAVSSSIKTTKMVVRWLLREPVLPSLGMGTWGAGIWPHFRKSKCERQSVYESQEQRNSETQWKHTALAPPALKTHVVPEAWLRTTRESLELSEAELARQPQAMTRQRPHRKGSVRSSGPQPLWQQGLVSQKTIFWLTGAGDVLGMIQVYCIYYALYCYYISSTSDH